MGIKSNNPTESYYNYFSDSGKDAVGAAPPGATSATGGFLSDYEHSGTWYRAHIFLNPGTFEVTEGTATCNYLVIGGGGGGGNSNGGGGGAGTVLYGEGYTATKGSYTVQAGGGGAGACNNTENQNPELLSYIFNGWPSYVFSREYTAPGGGGGGNGFNPGGWNQGKRGGSGGGGGTNPAGIAVAFADATSGTYPGSGSKLGRWGSNGGKGSVNVGNGGGGGGAGGVGIDCNAPTQKGGGGSGMTFTAGEILGIELKVGGGGGGGGPAPGGPSGGAVSDNPAATAAGGGQTRATSSANSPGNASALMGTGGGGGGGAAYPGSGGGSGAPGMVIVRYEIPNPGISAKATGGLITYTPTKVVHSFLWPGTFATEPTWSTTNVEYVCVAGGGAGGSAGTHGPGVGGQGGGGGAGGFRTNVPGVTTADPTVPLTGAAVPLGGPSSFAVTVGAGGYGINQALNGNNRQNGTPSSIAFPGGTITAAGGGSGGGIDGGNVQPGGSGGGSGDSNSDPTSVGGPGNNPATSPIQGHAGGNAPGYSGVFSGGGGGGAGAVGGTGGATPANGGAGVECSITGSPVYYAGGGGGGNNQGQANAYPGWGGAGNPHGIGVGAVVPPNGPPIGTPWKDGENYNSAGPGGHGTSGAGGGGGGTAYLAPKEMPGGNGGSGIVIIAYPV